MSYTHAIISPRMNCQNNPLVCVNQDFYIDNSTEKCHTSELKIDNVTIWSKSQCDSFMPHILLDWVKCNPVYTYEPKVYDNINCSSVVTSVKSDCIKWKAAEYCEANWLVFITMGITFVFFVGVLIYSCGVCPGTREVIVDDNGDKVETFVGLLPRRKRIFK